MKKVIASALNSLMLIVVMVVFLAVGCGQQPQGCAFTNDGECDDGRLGSHTNQCAPGTDQADCADVDPTVCQTTNDGECDDGRPGAEFAICAPGTDDADCADIS